MTIDADVATMSRPTLEAYATAYQQAVRRNDEPPMTVRYERILALIQTRLQTYNQVFIYNAECPF